MELKSPQPPRWPGWLIRHLCAPELAEHLLGDLDELFVRRCETRSPAYARRRYTREALRALLQPSLWRRSQSDPYSTSLFFPHMLIHHLTATLRNLKRYRTHTLLNVFGLALGLCFALIIFIKVQYELAFDRHHPDHERVYRLLRTQQNEGMTSFGAGLPYPLVPAMRQDYPELEAIAQVDANFFDPVIAIPQADGQLKKYQEPHIAALVDSEFTRIIPQQWILGDSLSALQGPNKVVISRSLAMKYYGRVDVVGEAMKWDNRKELIVSGVIADPLPQTEYPFQILISLTSTEKDEEDLSNWHSISSSVQALIKLPPNTSPEQFEATFPAFMDKYHSEESQGMYSITLEALTDVHFNREARAYSHAGSNRQTIWSLIVIGIFLVLTACINFVNLSTALVFTRAREVGIRKVLGSLRGQLMRYYLGEAFLITFFAMLLSLAALPVVMGQMGKLMGKADAIPWSSPLFWAAIGAALVLVSLLSGLYPAYLLSRLQPVNAMKNQFSKRYGQGLPLRKSLIVLQFGISQILIICTLVMLRQMDYFKEAPLGFAKDAVVEVMLPTNEEETLERFKNAMMQVAGVEGVAFTNSGVSSGNRWLGNFEFQPDSGQVIEEHAQVKFMDDHFLKTYGLQLAVGRVPAKQDSLKQFMVNQTFLKMVGLENPADIIGREISLWGRAGQVVGVVEDWHTTSLHDLIQPVIMMYESEGYYTGGVKLVGENLQPQLEALETIWSDTWPAHVFDSQFLDESIEEFYTREALAAKAFRLFAGIAILIGCLGLFGLISFMAAQRTKEIGIRKVLGASVGEILRLFSREFTILVVLGFVVAAPIAFYLMHEWLQDFAYRIPLGAGAFVISMLASMSIAYLTILYRAYRAASINPSQALRSE